MVSLKKSFMYLDQKALWSREAKNKVYKLKNDLYGLKYAPRAWNDKLIRVLGELNFLKCSKEPSMYRKWKGEKLLLVAVYVNDLLITDSS